MKDKISVIPINQDEISTYLKDIRKIKVMTPDREKELAKLMKSDSLNQRERQKIEEELYEAMEKDNEEDILKIGRAHV